MPAPSLKAKAGPGRSRAQDIDRHVGARMRERRITLGLTLYHVADLMGISYQQAHKYEHGTNRIAAGRLLAIARALGVEVSYFFEGMGGEPSFEPTPPHHAFLELSRNFVSMPRKHQEAIRSLARTLADLELAPSDDVDDKPPRDTGEFRHYGANSPSAR